MAGLGEQDWICVRSAVEHLLRTEGPKTTGEIVAILGRTWAEAVLRRAIGFLAEDEIIERESNRTPWSLM